MGEADNNQQPNPVPTPEQQTAMATGGPQPSPGPAPTAAPSAPAAPGAPTAPAAPAAPARPTAQQAVDQHHSLLGRAASAILGKSVDYQVDPTTGKTVAVETQQKPGDLFRHILAGAILGGAAAKGTNSVLAGFARGGSAGMQANEAMDESKRARAQQQFQNQREAARGQREQRSESRADEQLRMEQQKTTAQLEMWNKEQIMHERDANLRDAEFNQRGNENAQQMRKWATEAGGIDAPLPGNNEVGNGKAMMESFTKDPSKFAAPQGYNRFITQDHDTTGLTYDKNKGYVDEKGNAVDLADRTTWHVQFVPQKPQPIEITRGELYRLYPDALGTMPKGTKADDVMRMPFDQMAGLATTQHEIKRRDADEAYKRTHDDIRAELDEIKSKASNLTKQADEAERQQDFSTARDLRRQAQDAYDEYDKTKRTANPHSPLRNADSGRPGGTDMASLQAKVADWTLIPEDKAVMADKHGMILGVVPRNSPKYQQAVKDGSVEVARPGGKASAAASPSSPLAKLPPTQTLIRTPSGGEQIVDNEAVDNFLKRNSGSVVVGKGTKASAPEQDFGSR